MLIINPGLEMITLDSDTVAIPLVECFHMGKWGRSIDNCTGAVALVGMEIPDIELVAVTCRDHGVFTADIDAGVDRTIRIEAKGQLKIVKPTLGHHKPSPAIQSAYPLIVDVFPAGVPIDCPVVYGGIKEGLILLLGAIARQQVGRNGHCDEAKAATTKVERDMEHGGM